ncbi:MAG: TonB-dependent receptor [Gammaproteobacteria bacterium]|nr:MAG: TonB-dependent receptor [Gammaproteobacteria bacterium]
MGVKSNELCKLIALALSTICTNTAWSQQRQPDAAEPAKQMDTIIVTGTKVADRTVVESLSPIDIITPEALQSTGTTELATALSRLVPSLNFPRPAIADGSDGSRPAQLRGLSPDQVLVLVNGKRRHTSAYVPLSTVQGRGTQPVDLNAIPIAAIERVEVLRDGAAAQYGSDAIAGVVNIVLKGGSKHGSLGADMGQYSAGDGARGDVTGDGGFALGDKGWLHLAAQLGTQNQTDRARPYILGLGTYAPARDAPPLGTVVQRQGDPKIEQGVVSYNAEYKLSDAITLYSFAAASNRDSLSNGFFRTATSTRNQIAVYPNGFLPLEDAYMKDRSLVLGFKGRTENGWNWDVSWDYGTQHWAMDVLNSENQSLGPMTVLNADVSREFDFGWHAPVTLAFGAEYHVDKFNQSPGDPYSNVDGGYIVPFGANCTTKSGCRSVPYTQVFAGFKPSEASHNKRHNYSVYGDAETNLTDELSVGAAARYEDYSDFGDTTSGKLSGRYAFTDKIALRATASTGFRAPALGQQFFQSTISNFVQGVPLDIRTFRVDNPVAIALGALPLKPEKSTNYSLGLVMQPLDGLNITLDAYQIRVKDRIILSANLSGTAVINYLAAQGLYGVSGARFFTNAADTKSNGADLVGSYHIDLSAGSLDLTSSLNYNKTTLTKVQPNPAVLPSGLTLTRLDHSVTGLITCGTPRTKFNFGGVYVVSKFSFNANATRYGDVCNRNNTVTYKDAAGVSQTITPDQTLKAKWTLDLTATYHMTDHLDFTLGADNITNTYPTETLYLNNTNGQIPYSSLSPFGFNGAYVYGKVAYRW